MKQKGLYLKKFLLGLSIIVVASHSYASPGDDEQPAKRARMGGYSAAAAAANAEYEQEQAGGPADEAGAFDIADILNSDGESDEASAGQSADEDDDGSDDGSVYTDFSHVYSDFELSAVGATDDSSDDLSAVSATDDNSDDLPKLKQLLEEHLYNKLQQRCNVDHSATDLDAIFALLTQEIGVPFWDEKKKELVGHKKQLPTSSVVAILEKCVVRHGSRLTHEQRMNLIERLKEENLQRQMLVREFLKQKDLPYADPEVSPDQIKFKMLLEKEKDQEGVYQRRKANMVKIETYNPDISGTYADFVNKELGREDDLGSVENFVEHFNAVPFGVFQGLWTQYEEAKEGADKKKASDILDVALAHVTYADVQCFYDQEKKHYSVYDQKKECFFLRPDFPTKQAYFDQIEKLYKKRGIKW